MGTEVTITVNGVAKTSEIEPRLLLAQYLREILDLTGTHIGCDTTSCGACTIIMDCKSVKSCTVFAVQANASEITTVEGLADGNKLHPVQEGFWEKHGLQCGFCTPGMIMSSVSLLEKNPNPTEAEIRHGLAGNICRCTGYHNIVLAIEAAAKEMRG